MPSARATDHGIATSDGMVERRARLEAAFQDDYDSVYRFSLARCGEPTLAEEVAADVFAEAARCLADGQIDDISTAWLITVARRRLVDRWRSIGRHRRRMERAATIAGPRSYVDEPVGVADDAAVGTALKSLPERQRAALTLRYLDDYSVQEVADALGCAYPAAESLLARARRSFAKAYEEGARTWR